MRPDRHAPVALPLAHRAPIRSGLESGHLSVEPDGAATAAFLAALLAFAGLWLLSLLAGH